RTLGGLRRLGAASPVAAAQTLFEAQAADAPPAEPRLLTQARGKLQGAEVLIQQSCPGPALDLLLAALLAAAAARAGETIAPAPQQAGVWLYGEALPKGLLTPDQAGLIMRGLALAQGADAVPEPLVRTLAADVALFVEGGTDV
ncbi:MAG TPA: helicase, partial [Chromatiaceae bacterium]|nr:helicase [Chromatiaceae bacterium]